MEWTLGNLSLFLEEVAANMRLMTKEQLHCLEQVVYSLGPRLARGYNEGFRLWVSLSLFLVITLVNKMRAKIRTQSSRFLVVCLGHFKKSFFCLDCAVCARKTNSVFRRENTVSLPPQPHSPTQTGCWNYKSQEREVSRQTLRLANPFNGPSELFWFLNRWFPPSTPTLVSLVNC